MTREASAEYFRQMHLFIDGGPAPAPPQARPVKPRPVVKTAEHSRAQLDAQAKIIFSIVRRCVENPCLSNLDDLNKAIHAAHDALKTLHSAESTLANGHN